MLAFFRINDPYRLIILFVFCLLIRLPFFIFGESLTADLLNWQLIGESLNNGDILYKDFHEPIAPLAAWFFSLIDAIFGRTVLIYQLLALLLITYQFSLFNNIMFKSKSYNENSYIPALIYVILMHIFYDFLIISPALISLTFVLLVLDNIYLRIENKLNDATILKTGVLMGLAILFYLPSIVFLLATVLSLLLFTGMILRRYLMFLYGILLPFFAVMGYYFLQGAGVEVLNQWFIFTFIYNPINAVSITSLIVILGVPLLYFLISLYKTFTAIRFTNYQVRVQQVMFIMFVFALLGWWLTVEKAPYQMVIFIPFVTFFITHLIQQFKSSLKAELVFVFLLVSILYINYATYFDNSILNRFTDFQKIKVSNSLYSDLSKGKKVWSSGNNKSIYKNASVATDYFHVELSHRLLMDYSEIERSEIYFEDIIEHRPDVIMDLNHVLSDKVLESDYIQKNYRQKTETVFIKKVE